MTAANFRALFASLRQDAAPVAELDLTETAELVAVPETPCTLYTAEHRAHELAQREAEMADDEWTDEPTVADADYRGHRATTAPQVSAGGRASAAHREDAMTR